MKKEHLSSRLSGDDLNNLNFLANKWGLSNNSEIVRKALDLAADVVQEQEKKDKLKILKESTFIGGGNLENDLSKKYKSKIKQVIKKKYRTSHS